MTQIQIWLTWFNWILFQFQLQRSSIAMIHWFVECSFKYIISRVLIWISVCLSKSFFDCQPKGPPAISRPKIRNSSQSKVFLTLPFPNPIHAFWLCIYILIDSLALVCCASCTPYWFWVCQIHWFNQSTDWNSAVSFEWEDWWDWFSHNLMHWLKILQYQLAHFCALCEWEKDTLNWYS